MCPWVKWVVIMGLHRCNMGLIQYNIGLITVLGVIIV